MSAAVTGASGFLGLALVRALLARGRRVRALVRRSAAASALRALGAEPVMGDLRTVGGWGTLVEQGDVLIHAAARVAMTGRWEQFRQTTIEGTRHLLAAALPRRPQRVVYISSASVYAPDADPRGLCAERTPTRPSRYNYYARAKLRAERLVRSQCERAGCPWTILRLGFLFGPGNRALARQLRLLAQGRRLRIIGSGDNRIATLYIDDAVEATLLAGWHPAAAGRLYDVASAERVTQREFIAAMSRVLGLAPPPRGVRRAVAMAGAWLAEQAAGLLGAEPRVSRALVQLMSTDQVIDAGPMRRELGWRPVVSFAEGVRRMEEWQHRVRGEGAAGTGLPARPARAVSP